jgi:hypothetical protein
LDAERRLAYLATKFVTTNERVTTGISASGERVTGGLGEINHFYPTLFWPLQPHALRRTFTFGVRFWDTVRAQ